MITQRFGKEPTEWQRIGNQIDAAFVFARADLVGVYFFAWTKPSILG
jgi:hypothetical protein